jgi:UDP-glucuronate 4-epimerase
MATILLTGAAGFIGSHLSEALINMGHQVIGVDNFDSFYPQRVKLNNLAYSQTTSKFKFYQVDLRYMDQLRTITEPVDAVIHLAAKAGVLPSLKDPQEYINSNIIGTQHVLLFMQERGIKKYVFASSSSVYGNNKKIPFSETDNVDRPISPYAFTKKSNELMNFTFHKLYNIDTINLRFFTVYGPRQRPDLAIHKFIKMIKEDKPVTIYGDGSTARDYTFVADTVKGVVAALEYVFANTGVYEIVNLGNNSPVKLIDLVNTIYKVLDKEPNLVYLPMQPGDVDITYADISKAQKLLGYFPDTSLEIGIRSFTEWYDEQAQKQKALV